MPALCRRQTTTFSSPFRSTPATLETPTVPRVFLCLANPLDAGLYVWVSCTYGTRTHPSKQPTNAQVVPGVRRDRA